MPKKDRPTALDVGAPAALEPEPVKNASRSRKKAAPEPIAAEAAAVDAEPAKKATRSRKKAAAEPATAQPAPVNAVKKAAKKVAKAVKKQS